jgi:DNA (cytosine-5)-methyltransferase 1
MLSVNELFAGIGAQRTALKRVGVDYKIVGISEIDRNAIRSYTAIHGETRNYGDITQIQQLDYADLWTYSFPCTNISIAGKQEGMQKGSKEEGGTASGLLYEVQRLLNVAVEKNEVPKYLILENVKNLIGKRFKAQFKEWIQYLDQVGYNTYYAVLNAKDYGVPQKRERLFAVSIRKDIDQGQYRFPEVHKVTPQLKDYLEAEVPATYLLSDVAKAYMSRERNGKARWLYHVNNFEGLACTLTANMYKGVPYGVITNCVVEEIGNTGLYRTRAPHTTKEKSQLVRRLTPKECWRLMGFTDEEYESAAMVNSKSALYAQAGNSIVVNVLTEIIKELLKSEDVINAENESNI